MNMWSATATSSKTKAGAAPRWFGRASSACGTSWPRGTSSRVLVHSPDRLSRKYAYQVLLLEEFARHGVEIVFLQGPRAETPEDVLLLQFQGMIAEYEKAQIRARQMISERISVEGVGSDGSYSSSRHETD